MNQGEVIALMTVMGVSAFLLYPLVRALADRIKGRPVADARVLEEVQAARDDMLQELQEVKLQLSELNERMDFAERVLSKGRDAERLPPARRPEA